MFNANNNDDHHHIQNHNYNHDHNHKTHGVFTFACNPFWKEIQDQLLPGQTAQDRTDLLIRVFRLKLKKLLQKQDSANLILLSIEFQDELPQAKIKFNHRKESLSHENLH